MKKMTLPVILCLIALITTGISMMSCEKKEVTKKPQQTSVKKPGKVTDTEKLEPASGSAAVLSASCGPIECAPGPFFGFTHYNRVQITKNATTLAIYPASMRYTIYVRGTVVSGSIYNLTRIDEFTCSQNAPIYADALLANTTWYYVMISEPSSGTTPATNMVDIASPGSLIPFVTASGKDGLPCE